MADPVSIRERISRVFLTKMQAVTDIAIAYRRDDRGLTLQDTDAVVTTGEEELVSENANTFLKSLLVRAGVKIMSAEGTGKITDKISNKLISAITDQVMADRKLTEPGGVVLAVTTSPIRSGPIRPGLAGATASGARVLFQVTYIHSITDTGVGPGVPLLEE